MENSALTLSALKDLFLAWLDSEVVAGRYAASTRYYYQSRLDPFVLRIGPNRLCRELVAFDLEKNKTNWHSVQAVQRLFNWANRNELLTTNPFRYVKRPPLRLRERTLSPTELVHFLRTCRAALRRILMAQRYSLARPQELRAVRWQDLRQDLNAFVLGEFKAKKRRGDGARWRVLPIVPRLARLLRRLQRKAPAPDRHVFLNAKGRPWTANALRLAVRRAAARAGLDRPDLERVVAYTLRHTAATLATANGVQDRLLADIMGHVETRTTSRYQHLQPNHIVEGAKRATERKSA